MGRGCSKYLSLSYGRELHFHSSYRAKSILMYIRVGFGSRTLCLNLIIVGVFCSTRSLYYSLVSHEQSVVTAILEHRIDNSSRFEIRFFSVYFSQILRYWNTFMIVLFRFPVYEFSIAFSTSDGDLGAGMGYNTCQCSNRNE